MTANRSQQSSHQSIDSLSQIYSQQIRIKYGNSAPASYQNNANSIIAYNSLLKRSANLKNYISNNSNNPSLNVSLTNKQNNKLIDYTSKLAQQNRIDTNLNDDDSDSDNDNNDDEQNKQLQQIINKRRSATTSSSATSTSTRSLNNNNNRIKLPPLDIQSPVPQSSSSVTNNKSSNINNAKIGLPSLLVK